MAVISLVRHRDARADVGADVERRLELCAVAGLATGQMEIERVAVEVGFKVDFGREAAARAAERLALLPPLQDAIVGREGSAGSGRSDGCYRQTSPPTWPGGLSVRPSCSALVSRCLTEEGCQRVPPRGVRSRITSSWDAICCRV